MPSNDLFNTHVTVDPSRILQRLDELERIIPPEPHDISHVSPKTLKLLITRAEELRSVLAAFIRSIDPVEHREVYDPSHPESAAGLIGRKLEEQVREPLESLRAFWGSGVYALYYTGEHPAYAAISGREIPIYIGKADPRVANALTARDQGQSLFTRLKEHAKSIRAAESYADSHLDIEWLHPIRVAEFEARHLVLASAYSAAVEAALIRYWQPVWNREMRVCIGFGKHGDAAETRANTRSDWDTLHPGRTWATKDGNLPNRRSPEQIQKDVLVHLELFLAPHYIP